MKFALLNSFLASILVVQAKTRFNQTAGYNIYVSFDTWTNFGQAGGCKTCPYTCIKPQLGPDGLQINPENETQVLNLPAIYNQPEENGCCFASKNKLKKKDAQPSCSAEANPPEAEDCGFLMGPTLEWDITTEHPATRKSLPDDPVSAILFASIDCENFWAIGSTLVKQTVDTSASKIEGSKVINGGCYGDPRGAAIVLAGCLTSELEFDKSKTYTWSMLAQKCRGLSGQCSRTNGFWGQNLKCCKDAALIQGSEWDLNFEDYVKEPERIIQLSGSMIFGIVIGGVALLMLLVHLGAKVHERAKETEKMRHCEASDDYEEIVTPLNREYRGNDTGSRSTNPITEPSAVELSLSEGDRIYNREAEEVLYEGQM